MSEQSENNVAVSPPAESQKSRWIKYGSNVILSVILVIALAALLTWVAQRANGRLDTTAGGSLSLNPQTVNILRGVDQRITLVSLYSRPDSAPDKVAMAQRVADLLDEYKDESRQIDVWVIDPLKERDKLDELHQEFINRYGTNLKAYKDYLTEWAAQRDQIRDLIAAEAASAQPLSENPVVKNDYGETPESEFVRTVRDVIPDNLQKLQQALDKETAKKHPDYKQAVRLVQQTLQGISDACDQIIQQAQTMPPVSNAFKKYWTESVPRFSAIKKRVDDFSARAGTLGELKVDQLEQALNIPNPILVLGTSEWRILQSHQVWQVDADTKMMARGATVAPRFVGEQQITTAIYGLTHPKKPKVCFVRNGGPPVAQGMMYRMMNGQMFPALQEGQYRRIASHLAEYNFDVSERDLSGMWATQAQRAQVQPMQHEPTDEEIKDAVWIVLPSHDQGETPPMAGPLKEHLAHGGSALVLGEFQCEPMTEALKDWGIELHPQAMAVHEAVHLTGSGSDPLQEALANPIVFDCRDYGDHPLAKPIRNLDSGIAVTIIMNTHDVPGCNVAPLLPLSSSVNGLKTWGETDIDSLRNGNVTFDAASGDLPPPLYGGAAVEKNGAGRLVVLGSGLFMSNRQLFIPDPRLLQGEHPMLVNRFPGNMELATNSILWLSRLDAMMAISPSAMDVSRIQDMSQSTLNVWRMCFMGLLPAAVLIAGGMMYFSRKD